MALTFLRRFVLAGLLCCTLPAQAGTTWHVDTNASGAIHDGGNWCGAFLDLQQALLVAIPGDEIHVANGVYRPDAGTGDRTFSFDLLDGVSLLGGYAGCGAANPNGRDISVNETVLSGDFNDDDVRLTNQIDCEDAGGVWYGVVCDITLNNQENSYHVVTSVGNNDTAVIDGFTVSDGHADGPTFGPSPESKEQGSGINVYDGTPRIINCKIENNRADNHGAINDHGGATIIGCEVRNNFSIRWGGGLHNQNGFSTTVTDCLFIENATAGEAGGGGAIFCKGNPVVTGSVFTNNFSGHNGAAVYNFPGSSAKYTDCAFTENIAANNGGGMYSELAAPVVKDSRFENNTANALPGGGGAMFNLNSSPTFENCVITGNRAPNYNGGAMYNDGSNTIVIGGVFSDNSPGFHGGAVLDTNGGDSRFTNTLFINNTAPWSGGAISTNFESQLTLTNCVFNGNVSGQGGAMRIGGVGLTAPFIINCTFAANQASFAAAVYNYPTGASNIAGSVLWGNGGGAQNDQIRGGTPIVNYSCVQGLTGSLGGVGNIGLDPMYVDALGPDGASGTPDDDLRLALGSPCIDAGDNAAIGADSDDLDRDGDLAEPIPVDFDGNARFLNDLIAPDTGNGIAPIIDMGAYENGDDCNGNGIDDLLDIVGGTSNDCDGDGQPDECQTDCDDNGVADVCQVDSDGDGVIDPCDGCPADKNKIEPGSCGCGASETDIDGDTFPDCVDACPGFDDRLDADGDGVPDGCDACPGFDDALDCNQNFVADGCDIVGGTSDDLNGNGIPDECDLAPIVAPMGCRYLEITALPGAESVALRLTIPGYPCINKFLRRDGLLISVPSFATPQEWGTVYVRDASVIPSSTYTLQTQFADGTLSLPIDVTTAKWGDVTGGFVDGVWTPPDDKIEIIDALAALACFRHLPNAPPMERCDIQPQMPDGDTDILEIVFVLEGFSGIPYPFDGPAPCP